MKAGIKRVLIAIRDSDKDGREAPWWVYWGILIMGFVLVSILLSSSIAHTQPYPQSTVITSIQWHEVTNLGTD